MPVKFPKSEKYNFNKNLVKRHKLVTHLDRYLGVEVQDFHFDYEPKKHDKGFHPSGHCCMTAGELFAVISNDPEPKDWGVAMLKTFMVGHFWHQLLQKAVVDLELAPESAIERIGVKGWGDQWEVGPDEVTWPDWHFATGAGDVAPCSIPGHGDFVVDFKTMSAQQYRQNGVPDWAADKYEAQINMYMDFFDLEQALIVAICKDSPHEMKEFEYRRNQPLIDMVYAKWEFVSDCLDDNHAPDEDDEKDLSLKGLFTGPVAQ